LVSSRRPVKVGALQTHSAQDKLHLLGPVWVAFLSGQGLIAINHQVGISQEFFQETAAILVQGGAQSFL
jgi:hypothetical protein